MTTNLERIRQMTADELAEFLKWQSCIFCPIGDTKCFEFQPERCIQVKKQWLEQESEE